MTVGAEQDALPSLRSYFLEGSGQAAFRKPEPLRRGIDVMELECPEERVIAAYRTATARLGNESYLDTSPVSGDAILPTAGAAIRTAPLKDERDLTVPPAHAQRSLRQFA